MFIALLAGCFVSPPVLDSLSEQRAYPNASRLTLQAEAHPDQRGQSQRTMRHPRSVGSSDKGTTRHTWVVPLADPGASLDPVVHAWVTPPGFLEDAAVADWVTEVERALAVGPVTWKVGARVGALPESGRSRAVANACAAHGLSSPEGAPILVFPL